jgi:hypothetical protein
MKITYKVEIITRWSLNELQGAINMFLKDHDHIIIDCDIQLIPGDYESESTAMIKYRAS